MRQSLSNVKTQVFHTSHSSSSIIREELQVQQSSTPTRPPAKNLLPAALLLVAVRKGDVDMLQREVLLGQFFQTQDVGILRGILHPRTFVDKGRSDLFIASELELVRMD